jgi:hypothetical protein
MSSHCLESLPVRPPTPPRESHHDLLPELPLNQAFARPPVASRAASLQTPPNTASPKSALANSNSSLKRSGKIVAFSLQAEYREAPSYVDENGITTPSGPLVPSAKTSRPQKGILKPFMSPNPLDISFNNVNGASTPGGLIKMLDSSVRQLACTDRVDRMDAYTTLSRALRSSNNLPDRVALQDRMPRFMEFIQRDIAASPLDSSLAIHALTLLTTILHFPGIASALSHEFAVFIVEHCTKSFGDKGVPKDVMRHLLQVVAQQDFAPRIMTSDRVGKLVLALNNVEQFVTGKSIVHTRILIYKRLLKQCKPHMIAHNGWLRDLVNDCLSSNKDIRGAAIVLGFEAAFAIGKDRSIARKLAEIFTVVAEDQKYIDFYLARLASILKNKQEAFTVPRIWSIVLLLLRGSVALEKWAGLNPCLRLIQKCFNTSDVQTKQEANYAWNRFVYVMHFDEKAFAGMLEKTFRQPVCSQWNRKMSSAKTDEGWQSVIFGSACNLFYYAFKPGSAEPLLNQSWDHALKPIVRQLCRTPARGTEDRLPHAVAVLTHLFDSTTRRAWNEDRVATNPVAEPSELPAVDPRWLRRNASRVFDLLDPILLNNLVELADGNSPTSKMWQVLITSVASAASKEIKVSFETTDFVSRMFTTLVKLWNAMGGSDQKLESLGDDDDVKDGKSDAADEAREQVRIAALKPVFLSSIREWIMTAILALGVLPFTEKQLCDRQGIFTPAATPSTRPAKSPGLVKTAVHHLFGIFSTLPENVADNDEYRQFLQSVFAPFFKHRRQRAASELAQEMLASIPADIPCPCGVWCIVASIVVPGATSAPVRDGISQTSSASDAPVAREYRDIAKLLERGLRSTPNLSWTRWTAVLAAFERHVSDETLDSGRALAVVEPLAKVALEMTPIDCVWGDDMSRVARLVTTLLSLSTQPRDRQAMDLARRRLWGTPGSKTGTFDPFDNLYKVTNVSLIYLYENLEQTGVEELSVPFLKELAGFLSRCSSSLVLRTISTLQEGLVLWVKDPEGRLSFRQLGMTTEAVSFGMHRWWLRDSDGVQTKKTWDRICDIIQAQQPAEQIPLETIEPLLCAAFQSRHRHVVNTATLMWNRVFNDADEVRYPSALRSTLLQVRELVDIVLPGLEGSSSDSAAQALAQRDAFMNSQDDMNALKMSDLRSSSFRDQVRLVPSASPVVLVSPVTAPANNEALLSSRGKAGRAKLRHEDSQIQFQPIESSPSAKQLESQVLTDRQLEVRERQRDESGLYDIRSSSPPAPELRPEGFEAPVEVTESPALPKAAHSTPKKSTPKAQREYDNYISSTPTPRRGNALPLDNDVEMSDPPSSPPEVPEVRRYPLADEIRSRCNSKNEIPPWDFSSSPVSGSPLPQHRVIVQDQDVEDDADMALPDDADDSRAQESVVEDSFNAEMVHSSAPVADGSTGAEKDENPETPRATKVRSNASTPSPISRSKVQETPRSDNEEFVDALTSPAVQEVTPSRRRSLRVRSGQTDETSYAISTGAEQSMIRAADEAVTRQPNAPSAVSSEITTRARSSHKRKVDAPVLDCITVAISDEDAEEQDAEEPEAKDQAIGSGHVIPATPDEKLGSQAPKRGPGRPPKRKRAASKNLDKRPERAKRRRSTDGDPSAPSQHQASPIPADLEVPSLVASVEEQAAQVVGSPKEMEDEVQSQVMSEHIAASQCQSRASPDLSGNFVRLPPRPQEIEMAMGDHLEREDEDEEQEEAAVPATTESSPASSSRSRKTKKSPAARVETYMRRALDKMRGATLTREEMNRIEDLFIDFKRELYDAEQRGRTADN